MANMTAESLVSNLMLDCWPSMGACVDFGLDGAEKDRAYRAYQQAIRAGVTVQQFHAALLTGDRALTALVRANSDDKTIVIVTAWAAISDDDDEDHDEVPDFTRAWS